LTVREAWEEYSATRAAPPDARDRSIWQRFIAPTLAQRLVGDLTTAELERWLAAQVSEHGARRPARTSGIDEREGRRRAQYTANRRFNLLRAILNSAYRKDPDRVPNADAWRRVRAFRRVDRPRTRVLTAAECRRLLDAMPSALRALALGALYSGCRLGELLALRACDVVDGRVQIEHSKSGRARFVPLSPEGAAFFGEASAARRGEDRVFETVSRIAVSRGMRSACRAAEIAPPATFHDLRRSYGSLLLNSGAPVHIVQELLGHADLRTTRRAYAHLTAATLQRAVDAHLPSFAGSERTRSRKPK
jgi:integrase